MENWIDLAVVKSKGQNPNFYLGIPFNEVVEMEKKRIEEELKESNEAK